MSGNAISFLQVQDGILESSGKILDRMAELKALSQDVLKNSSDIANYNSEFRTCRYNFIKWLQPNLMESVFLEALKFLEVLLLPA